MVDILVKFMPSTQFLPSADLLSFSTDIPSYILYQRDSQDVSEPSGILWYDASVQGSWWDGMDLDKDFPVPEGAWASFRGSWIDENSIFVGIKAGKLKGHQSHGHLVSDTLTQNELIVTDDFGMIGCWYFCLGCFGRKMGGRIMPGKLSLERLFSWRRSG
jgi:hypothetical protein